MFLKTMLSAISVLIISSCAFLIYILLSTKGRD